MKKVAIIYYSQTETTAKLSQAVKAGLHKSSGIDIIEHRIVESEIEKGIFTNEALLEKISDCDAVLFGSPTHMGMVSGAFKLFCDSTGLIWKNQKWAGKLAAGFKCGSGINGDHTSTLHYLVTFACQHGMLWAGIDTHNLHNDKGINRFGCQIGATAQSFGELDGRDLATAQYLGERLGKLVTKSD